MPGKLKLEVAWIVWELGGATVRQVLDTLPAERGLDLETVSAKRQHHDLVTGRTTRKRAPSPGVLSTSILPPWS